MKQTEPTAEEVIFITANHRPMFGFNIMQCRQVQLLDDVHWLSTKMQQSRIRKTQSHPVVSKNTVFIFCLSRTLGMLYLAVWLSDVLTSLLLFSHTHFSTSSSQACFSPCFANSFVIQFKLVPSLHSVTDGVMVLMLSCPSAVDFLRGWTVCVACVCLFVSVCPYGQKIRNLSNTKHSISGVQ